MPAASLRSLGRALAPATTLNRMYHCVPRMISGDSQILGSSRAATIPITTKGKITMAGKAARNWATGWMRWDHTGRRPIQTPIGTQIRLAMAIRMRTRASVRKPSPNASNRSWMRRLAVR